MCLTDSHHCFAPRTAYKNLSNKKERKNIKIWNINSEKLWQYNALKISHKIQPNSYVFYGSI